MNVATLCCGLCQIFHIFLYFRQYDEKSCCRFIHSFKCGPKRLFRDEIRNEDVEFITIFIKGQSFMLHQIRKMIGKFFFVVKKFTK